LGKAKSKVRIVFLGGLDGIGKNMMAFECDDTIVLVDAGMMFPDDEMLGIDKVIADLTYVRDNKEKIKALVLTHGHEDHIGAIRNLFDEVSVPIYGTKLTLILAKNKLKREQYEDEMLHEVSPRSKVEIGPFTFEFIRVCHSIPDCVGLAINTPQGMIVHSGDFKIDYTPIDGQAIDLNRFAEIGDEGVLALLTDSTNADTPGYNLSEKTVGETFHTLFRRYQANRIIIVSFASNIHRIQQAIDAAKEHNRKVLVIGRSMEESVSVARKHGYINCPESIFASISDIKSLPPNKAVIITTGSQGERMSVISRMAYDSYKGITLNEKDCVILSSAPIPGNEKGVNTVINEITRKGAQVVYEANYEVHVSGHACIDELKLMTSLVKPKYLIPVHGEHRHLEANASIGVTMGIPRENVFVLDNGDVLEFSASKAAVVDHVPGEAILLDGFAEEDRFNIVQTDRRKLAKDGILVVSMALREDNKDLLSEVKLNSRGFIYMSEDLALKESITDRVIQIHKEYKKESDGGSTKGFKKYLNKRLADYIYQLTKRRPMILPVILMV
jgi:ribonuclease J